MTVARGIEDLPIELFRDEIFKYLDNSDIHNLSLLGSQRMKEISEACIGQLCKFMKTVYTRIMYSLRILPGALANNLLYY